MQITTKFISQHKYILKFCWKYQTDLNIVLFMINFLVNFPYDAITEIESTT